MAQVQCIALVPDFPEPEPMVCRVFESFYEIACARDQVAGIEYYLGSILSQLIGEYQALPQSVTELILSHLLHSSTPQSKDPKNLSLPMNVSRGYTISREICTENIDIMIRHVNQYFSDLFTGFHENEDALDDSEELDKTQQLLIEIWKAVPELLSSIVGQLEQELSIECFPLRLMATTCIGEMVSNVPSRVNFLRDHHSAFTLWLGRIRDKDPKIRTAWTEGAYNIILNRSDQAVKEVVPLFLERVNDSDEHVRQTACMCLGEFPIETFVNKFPLDDNGSCLCVLSERIRDKKHLVRTTAFETVGKIYNGAYEHEKAYSMFSWIPTSLYETLLLNDKDVNELLDATLFNHVFPQTFDDDKRARRLLSVSKSLSPSAWKAFSAISQRQLRLAKVFNSLLTNIKALHAEPKQAQKTALSTKVEGLVQWFAKQFSSEDKMGHVLQQIVDSKDKQAYKLLSTCVSQEYGYKPIVKAINEILKRFKNDGFLKVLLYRMSYLVYNKSIIAPIVAVTRNPQDTLHDISQQVLREISAALPSLLKSQIQDLVSILETAKPGTEGNVNTLKAASRLFKEFSKEVPESKVLMKNLMHIALTGTTAEAKQAVNALQCSEKKEMYCDDLMNDILNSLDPEQEQQPEHLSTRLASLAQLYSYVPTVLEESQSVIMQYLVQNVLLGEVPDTETEEEGQEQVDWVEDKDVPENCLDRIMAIRVLVNRLRAVAGWENAKELSRPVFKLLSTIISNGGDIHPEKPLPLAYKSRLRLDSGIKLLKLAKIDFYNKMISADDLNLLVFLIQDSCLPVRERFTRTLIGYLSTPQTISDRYLPLLFMGALEPDKELSSYMCTWIRSRFQKQQAQASGTLVMERSFSRLVYLVANHQDLFDEEEKLEQDIKSATKYILHYLKLIATEKNISVIFYVAQKIKEHKDVNEDKSKVLYLVSDLAQFIILKFVHFKSWNMEAWPGNLALPADMFRHVKPSKESEKVAKTLFFPEQYNTTVEDAVRSSTRNYHTTTTKQHADQDNNAPKKRVGAKTKKKPSKKPKTEKPARQTYGPVRHSSRNRKQVSYKDDDDDDDTDENDHEEEEESDDESDNQSQDEANE
ncbi:hypothetical protein TRICI_006172 [Trichomonascus ciferrii]|uniref:Uncharacterized protein n=1 Tax=Trichomonascus ciferrii TaxID=44093 RepID=A0A642UKH4_9ASCO|nr:hypothetical protein TRICI_006172 [Trichomonascus ciferrii]